MATAMHSADHARMIADTVAKFRKGEMVDDLVFPICAACSAPQRGAKKLQCSKCKAIHYCNIQCATKDWQGMVTPTGNMGERHKDICGTLKLAVLKKSDMQAIANQFPWARQQSDGTFSFVALKGSKSILGTGAEFGWWTEQPCCNDRSTYTWGFRLLEDQHLRERDGWKLPDNHIPWLDFGLSGTVPPKAPAQFEHNWKGYYGWRGLSIDSPAALLLHWPLTAFRLLSLLGFVPSPPPTERRQLTVYLLGVEKELDFVPIFGELALLLPQTDLHLTMFGPGINELLKKANKLKKPTSCLARQPTIYSYTAPKSSGSGSINISFSPSASPFLSGQDLQGSSQANNTNTNTGIKRPDAMIAFNAGLATYLEWKSVVIASRAFAIPFAVTDYQEVSLGSDIRLLMRQLVGLRRVFWDGTRLSVEEERRAEEAMRDRYVHGLNPFMLLGPRPHPIGGGPSAVNGFEMVITPGPTPLE